MRKKIDIGYVFLVLMVITNLMVISVYGATLVELVGISILCAITIVCIDLRAKVMMNNLKMNGLDQE